MVTESIKLWHAAKSFSELCDLNKKFLLGDLNETPYHCGPIDEETIPLVPKLLALHDLGILTYSVQLYENEKTGVYDTFYSKWIKWQQRPYLSFVMLSNNGRSYPLFYELKKEPDILVCAMNIHPFNVLDGSDDECVVTRCAFAEEKSGLENSQWENYARCSHRNPEEEPFFNMDLIRKLKPVLFDIVAKRWEEDMDLLEVVKRTAEKCSA